MDDFVTQIQIDEMARTATAAEWQEYGEWLKSEMGVNEPEAFECGDDDDEEEETDEYGLGPIGWEEDFYGGDDRDHGQHDR
jgi:hypothetical protein